MTYEIRLFQPVDHIWCADAYHVDKWRSRTRIYCSAGREHLADAAREAVQEIEKHQIVTSVTTT